MQKLITGISIIALMAIACPLWADDFTADDFDPANPALAEDYQGAVADLMTELAVVAKDPEGTEIFAVVPYPMELVGLLTQTKIHRGNVTDPDALNELVNEANDMKPAPNSFAFILDGHPDWVTRQVTMYYYPDPELPERVEVTLEPLVVGEESGENTMMSEWAVVMENMVEIHEFLSSPKVELIIGEFDEDIEPVVLDCGFWRQWGLFDLGEEEE